MVPWEASRAGLMQLINYVQIRSKPVTTLCTAVRSRVQRCKRVTDTRDDSDAVSLPASSVHKYMQAPRLVRRSAGSPQPQRRSYQDARPWTRRSSSKESFRVNSCVETISFCSLTFFTSPSPHSREQHVTPSTSPVDKVSTHHQCARKSMAQNIQTAR